MNGKTPRGAKGNRTPDLLVANETRYQLRYSPVLLALNVFENLTTCVTLLLVGQWCKH